MNRIKNVTIEDIHAAITALFEQDGDWLMTAMRKIRAICINRTEDDSCSDCPCRQLCNTEPYDYILEVK